MVKARHRGKLIYFHKGHSPTEKDMEAAYAITHTVMFRAGHLFAPGALEKADAVAGNAIPKVYAKAYPVVKTAADFTKVLADDGEAKKEAPANPANQAPAWDKNK